ncbi:hypothetical protein [Bartonella sp. B17]
MLFLESSVELKALDAVELVDHFLVAKALLGDVEALKYLRKTLWNG